MEILRISSFSRVLFLSSFSFFGERSPLPLIPPSRRIFRYRGQCLPKIAPPPLDFPSTSNQESASPKSLSSFHVLTFSSHPVLFLFPFTFCPLRVVLFFPISPPTPFPEYFLLPLSLLCKVKTVSLRFSCSYFQISISEKDLLFLELPPSSSFFPFTDAFK